jgi:hypothetical protein
MTTTKDYDVIDKHGKRVRRSGILEDGDRVRVPMTMMDAENPALADAMALARSIARNEQFDARAYQPNYRGGVFDQAEQAKRDSVRDAYIARTGDAWKKPPSVTQGDATALEQVAIVGPSAPVAQLQAARDQAISNRDKRLEAAWQR